jgi:pimeloyl-ACP methyl ester carboxylesterase
MAVALQVDGVDIHVDGAGPRTLLMVHGWPDTWRLWDAQVAAFSADWRCVRFTLPGFDIDAPRRVLSLDAMVGFLMQVIDRVSPQQPVVLLLHDWGCLFGYELAMRHPQRVERLIGVDIGDAGSRAHLAGLGARAKAMIAGYQLWLAAAWGLGALGNRMTRAMARWLRCPAQARWIGAQMNYPYVIQWTGRHGGYRHRARFDPACPMLYVYGTRKPVMFHSAAWAEALAARPRCRVLPLHTGHWVMCNAPADFNRVVRDWLARSDDAAA